MLEPITSRTTQNAELARSSLERAQLKACRAGLAHADGDLDEVRRLTDEALALLRGLPTQEADPVLLALKRLQV